MKNELKKGKRRLRGLFAIAVALILVASWIQVPKVVHATENAFPEASLASEYDSGSVSGSGDTGSSDTGSSDTGSSGGTDSGDTGSSDTGSGDTGSSGGTDSGDTGSGDTGSSDTGSGDTGSGDTGSGDTGSGDNTGSGDTGSGDSGSGDAGSDDTGSGDNTGSGDAGSGDTGSGDTEGDDTESGDNTGSGDTEGDDTESGDNTGSGDTEGGNTGSDNNTESGGETGGANDGGSAGSGSTESGDASSSENPSNTETPKAKANGQVSVRMDDYVYGGTAPSVWVSSLTGDAKKATITYKLTGAADSTYSSRVPTEAGNYTVRAVLPATDTHTSAAATDTFTINYLTAPTPAFNISGIRGEGGWYTSDVRIKPPAGYEISVGDRNHFSTEAYVISETQSDLRLYLKKSDTGEMTAQLAIAHLRIDKADPVLKGIINDETYYGDEFVINVVEANIKSVQVNGTEVELEQDENGNNVIVLKPGNELKEYEVSVTDKAGNKSVYQFKLASESTLEGMVREGEMTLEPGVKYTFPQGSDWKMYGDDTIYSGGVSFYVTQQKTVHFSKY